jgi:hypothetical protein
MWLLFMIGSAIIWATPNSQTIVESAMAYFQRGGRRRHALAASLALIAGAVAGFAILQISAVPSKFIYFQF